MNPEVNFSSDRDPKFLKSGSCFSHAQREKPFVPDFVPGGQHSESLEKTMTERLKISQSNR